MLNRLAMSAVDGPPAAAVVALLLTLLVVALITALVARQLRFPYTLALVLVGLALGLLRILPNLRLAPDTVLFIFIPVLLFEGAWSSDYETMARDWLAILLLAVPGLLLALGIVALVVHAGSGMSWLVALLVGAIVSPTDPIAVVALLRQLGMPARLRTIIEGESLFNDGVGAAVYTIVLGLLLAAHGAGVMASLFAGMTPTVLALRVLWLFVGGPLLGIGVGVLVARLLRHIDDHLVQTAATFSVAYGIYLIADALGTSGLLAVVCAGLTLRGYGHHVSMLGPAREAVDNIWEFAGYLANSLLFLLLGVQIGTGDVGGVILPVVWAVIAVVAGRAIVVYGLFGGYNLMARRLSSSCSSGQHAPPTLLPLPRGWMSLFVLAGLRGALSLALVLSLPAGVPQRLLLQRIVYGVVLFTLLVQGIGMRLLLPHWGGARAR